MDAQPTDLLLRKLSSLGPLTQQDRQLLQAVPFHIRDVGPDIDLVREGDRPGNCLILQEGFCCRYKSLADGRRQILSFAVPGDFLDLPSLVLDRIDHNISTLTSSKLAAVPRAALADLLDSPSLARLLWRDTLIDASVYREWVLNIGRRNAYQRVAHVLCELTTRLSQVGLAHNGVCELPLTQGELADATGLSTVHVNRVIQELRRDGLIAMKGRYFSALHWDRLQQAAGFEPGYLYLPPNPEPVAANR